MIQEIEALSPFCFDLQGLKLSVQLGGVYSEVIELEPPGVHKRVRVYLGKMDGKWDLWIDEVTDPAADHIKPEDAPEGFVPLAMILRGTISAGASSFDKDLWF